MKYAILILYVGLVQVFAFSQNKTKVTSAEITFTFVSKGVKGNFSGFNSSSTLDLANISNSKFKGWVQSETIKTGNFLRDWSLKGTKYFNVDDYPKISFESTSVSGTTDAFIVEGELTLKNTTRPITINFKKEGNRFVGTTTLNAADYGIKVIKKRKEDNQVNVQLILNF